MCRRHVRAIACARRDLVRNLRSGHRPAVRRNAARRSMRVDQEIFARSARTRRPGGHASGRPLRRKRLHIGMSQSWCAMKCRGGCLEHKASPTRRGRPLQAVISKVFQIQSATSSRPKPRNVVYPSCLARSSARFIPIAFGSSGCRRPSVSLFLQDTHAGAPEKFRHRTAFSHCYELQSFKAWKASLTCTPPLICTSALFLNRSDLKNGGAAND